MASLAFITPISLPLRACKDMFYCIGMLHGSIYGAKGLKSFSHLEIPPLHSLFTPFPQEARNNSVLGK